MKNEMKNGVCCNLVVFIWNMSDNYCSVSDIYLCMSDKSSTFVLRFEKGILFLSLEEHFF